MSDLRKLTNELMLDPAFRKEYESLQPEMDITRAILDARIRAGLKQSELSVKNGINQDELNERTGNVIFMIGLMGSGKTTVGRILAQKLGAAFLDTDELIEEREGMKISEIFEKFGEPYFRDLETALLEELRNERKTAGNPNRSDGRIQSDEQRRSNDSKSRAVKAIISVGGGLPVREKNRELMREIGTTILLNANEETLLQRLMGDDTRPLLRGGDLLERIRTLSRARMALYRDVADLEVQVDDRTPEEIANEVILRLQT